jgi:RNA polymerase sigma factor (sigma-70 family)
VIEDACQFAWSRLVHHRDRVRRETALAWLVTTATHEALKLVRRTGSELSLETVLEQGTEIAPLRPGRPPEALAEDHERLASLTSLSPPQQRVLWLFGLGLSYEEIARRQGCTSRAVERQLQRARATLRAREAEASGVRSR